MDALIGSEIGGCLLRRVCGTGAIGTVYEGRHIASDERMAVKVLSPKINAMKWVVERFTREARLCYQIEHPHLIRVHTWGAFSDGRHYMVMDFIDGTTFLQLVRRHQQLDWPVACSILADVANALAHAHDLDIVHRDIKPANVLVTRDARGVLTDLGLARRTVDGIDENDGRRLTTEGSALGSPAYMAPEQITDTRTVGPAADIYGLGASLFHALAGDPPLLGENPTDTLMRVMREPAPDLRLHNSDIPPELAELVACCLSKEPDDRPHDAADLEQSLRQILAQHGFAPA